MHRIYLCMSQAENQVKDLIQYTDASPVAGVYGSVEPATVEAGDDTTLEGSNSTIHALDVSSADGDVTVSLPNPSTASMLMVKVTDASNNAVSLGQNDSEEIEGSASSFEIVAADGNNVCVEVVSDGTNWHIVSRYDGA